MRSEREATFVVDTQYIAIIRTITKDGQNVFVKGPFDSYQEAKWGARAHVENKNGPGGCGSIFIIPVLSEEYVHEYDCNDGDKCGWKLVNLSGRS